MQEEALKSDQQLLEQKERKNGDEVWTAWARDKKVAINAMAGTTMVGGNPLDVGGALSTATFQGFQGPDSGTHGQTVGPGMFM